MAASSLIGNLAVLLTMDTTAFEKGTSQAQRQLAQTQRKFDAIGSKMQSLGKTMSLSITAPLVAIGLKSFETAKDVQEMQSAFDVTFGSMAESTRKWAEETGNAMGRSTQEIQAGALAFQELFSKALDPAKSTAMSKSFAVLTQDLASFKNLSNEVAQQKLFAGLAGEAEPLRAVGVFLSEAKVQAAALDLGLTAVNGKLTEEQKIIARSKVIQDELAKAQGDVIRTQDSAANQIKKATAAWEELQVVIGTKLLPVLTPLITKIASALDWFVKLPKPIQDTALVIAAVAAAAGPLLMVIGSLITIIPKLGAAMAFLFANPIILGAAALIGAIYVAWKNWDKIAPIVQKMVAGVKAALNLLLAPFKWVIEKTKLVTEAFRIMADKVVFNSYVPDMVTGIGQHMAKLDALMVEPAKEMTAKTAESFRKMQESVGQLKSLLANLYPEAAKNNQLLDDMAILQKALKDGTLNAEMYADALGRLVLRDHSKAVEDGITAVMGTPSPKGDTTLPEMGEFGDSAEDMAKDAEEAKVRVIQAFGDMAVGVLDSLRSMTAQLKQGDILGALTTILDTVLKVLTTLSSVGILKLPGAGPPISGARATGGPVVRGRTYLVGEKGPELFSAGQSGRIISNDNMGGMSRVQVVPSPYFDVIVDGRAKAVAAPMAVQAAGAGAGGAATMAARRERQTIR